MVISCSAMLIWRLFSAIPTLFVLVTLAFFLIRVAPGGPFDDERQLPAEIEANLKRAYNLDAPLWQQYFAYLGRLLAGDFGPSFKYKDYTVTELIWSGFPVSLRIGLAAIVLAVVVGTALGVVAALRQNSRTRLCASCLSRCSASRCRTSSWRRCSAWCSASTSTCCRWPAGAAARCATWCCRSSHWRCRRSPMSRA